MRYALVPISLSLALVGCAKLSTPTPVRNATPTPSERLLAFQDQARKDLSTIVVVRDEGFFGGRCFHGIWIDGVLAGKLEPAEIANFYVEPGEHTLTVGNVGSGNSACDSHKDRIHRETTVRQNQKKVFRALWNTNDGIPDIQPYIQ